MRSTFSRPLANAATSLALGAIFVLFVSAASFAVEPAGESLEAAFDAQLRGELTERDSVLHRVIKEDPENAVARSMLGQIRVNGSWQDVENAIDAARKDPVIREYEQLRRRVQGTANGQLLLARFCEKHDLDDRARFHWRMVLRAKRDHREAIDALGLHEHRGRLMTPEQIQRRKAADSASAEWRDTIEQLVRQAESDEPGDALGSAARDRRSACGFGDGMGRGWRRRIRQGRGLRIAGCDATSGRCRRVGATRSP